MIPAPLIDPAMVAEIHNRLWPFQVELFDSTRASIRQGYRRILIVSPTGSGKSFTIGRFVIGAAANGKRVLFGVNRRSLVLAMSKDLDKIGVDHGVIMAGHPRNKPWLPVQVASIQTLSGRRPPAADIIIADEAHFTITDGWLEIFAKYPEAVVIGLTATPIRTDGRGMGRFFQHMIQGPSVAELTAQGYLVPAVVYGPPGGGPDLSNVKVGNNGEYEKHARAAAMGKATLIGDIVQHWLEVRGEPTVCFADNIAHSMQIRDRFLEAGVRCKHVDAKTSDTERDRTWRQLQDYELEVVTSVGIISYGWDAPLVTTMIDASPTASLQRAIQKWGRVLRTAQGKTRARILDHAGNTVEHGFVDDERTWTLKDGYKPKRKGEKAEAGIYYCKKCTRAYLISRDRCPECDEPRVKLGRELVTVEGQLQEVAPTKQYYRCPHCEKRGILEPGRTYNDPCPACGVTALMPLAKADPVLLPSEIAERKTWYLRAAEDAMRAGFGLQRANVQYLARWETYAPKKWRDEAARMFAPSGFEEIA